MYVRFDEYLHFNLNLCEWYELKQNEDDEWMMELSYSSGPRIIFFDSEFEGKNFISKIVTNVNKSEDKFTKALNALTNALKRTKNESESPLD